MGPVEAPPEVHSVSVEDHITACHALSRRYSSMLPPFFHHQSNTFSSIPLLPLRSSKRLTARPVLDVLPRCCCHSLDSRFFLSLLFFSPNCPAIMSQRSTAKQPPRLRRVQCLNSHCSCVASSQNHPYGPVYRLASQSAEPSEYQALCRALTAEAAASIQMTAARPCQHQPAAVVMCVGAFLASCTL